MIIKLKLSTGKEIELTKEEMDELKENFKEIQWVTTPVKYPEPVYPWTVPNPNPWTTPWVTYESTC